MLHIFEGEEAVIKMIIKGLRPLRHVSRTHWVAFDWMLDRINHTGRWWIHIPNRRWLQQIVRETTNSEYPLSGGNLHAVRSEDPSGEIQGESEESQLAEPTDDAKAWRYFFGRFKVTSSLEFNSLCGRRKHSLFHWNTSICDQGCFHKSGCVAREWRTHKYWNVDANRSLSDSWKGITSSL